MRQRQPVKCQCGSPDCTELHRCDSCELPILEDELFYSLTLEIVEVNNRERGRKIAASVPLIVRHLRCGITDVFRKLEIEDPNLELYLLDRMGIDPGDRRDIN